MEKGVKLFCILWIMVFASALFLNIVEGISYYEVTEECYRSGGVPTMEYSCSRLGLTCLHRYKNSGPCGGVGGDASRLWEKESCDAERYFCPSYVLCCRCKNDCNAGQKSCGTGIFANFTRTCGNYDRDSCLEWSSYTACPGNYPCIEGMCVLETTLVTPLAPATPLAPTINIIQTSYDIVGDNFGKEYYPRGPEIDYADLPSVVIAGTHVEVGFKADMPELRESCINVSAINMNRGTSSVFSICGLKQGWWSVPLTVNSQARMSFEPIGIYNIPSDFVLDSGGLSIDMEWTKTITQNTKLLNDIFLQEDGLTINQSGIELDCQGHKIVGSGFGYGILVNGKRGVTIKNCFILNFSEGITFISSQDSNIINNQIEKNTNFGLRLDFSERNQISGNKIYNNRKGVYLVSSDDNIITGNFLTDNIEAGINIMGSVSNLIYNNVFENRLNVWDNGINFWNTTKTPGMSIVGGPFIGGNYWSDYGGGDNTGDKIGDTGLPYNSNKNIMNSEGDWLPLVYVSGVSPDCGLTHLSLCNTEEECEGEGLYWWSDACHTEGEGEEGECKIIEGKTYWVTDSDSQLSEKECKKYGKTCCLHGQMCVQILGQWECASLGGRCNHYGTKEECSEFTNAFASSSINEIQGQGFCGSSNEDGKVSCFCYWNELNGKCEASWNRIDEQNQMVVEECNYISSESLCERGFKKIIYTSSNPDLCGMTYEKTISCEAGRSRTGLYIMFSLLSALTAAIVFYFEKQPILEILAKLKGKVIKS